MAVGDIDKSKMNKLHKKVKDKIKSFRKSFAKILFDKKIKSNKILDMSKAKSILFFRNDDKIGDMVISTLLFREVKKHYPDIKVFVLCGKNNKEIIKYNPNVDEIIEISGKIFKDLQVFKYLKSKKIDIAVDFFPFRPRPKHLLMMKKIDSEFLIGLYKEQYNTYDYSLNVDYKKCHITEIYRQLLEFLEIHNPRLNYDIYLAENEEDYAKTVVSNLSSSKILFLNTYAAMKDKHFSFEKISNLIFLLQQSKDVTIILNTTNEMQKNFLYNDKIYIPTRKDILSVAALIKKSDFVITPDTSIVHIAAAFNKKMIALYLSDDNSDEKLNAIWAPNYSNAVQLSVDTKNGILPNNIDNIDNSSIVSVFCRKDFYE